GIEQGRLRAEASRAEAERLRQREAFLADASRELSASLDYETTLSTVARLAVPTIADWCAVDVLDDNGSARRLVVTHEDPAKIELAEELSQRYPVDPGASGAIITGESQLVPEISDAMLIAAAQDGEHLRILQGLG